jgi:hypothetical protein
VLQLEQLKEGLRILVLGFLWCWWDARNKAFKDNAGRSNSLVMGPETCTDPGNFPCGVVETDSANLMTALLDDSFDPAPGGLLIQEAGELLSFVFSVKEISHCNRSCNSKDKRHTPIWLLAQHSASVHLFLFFCSALGISTLPFMFLMNRLRTQNQFCSALFTSCPFLLIMLCFIQNLPVSPDYVLLSS